MMSRSRLSLSTRPWARLTQVALVTLPLAAAGACDGSGMGDTDELGGAGGADGDGTDHATGAGPGTDFGSDLGSDLGGDQGTGAGPATGGAGGAGPVCETEESEAELDPVYIAVAFDVSGSMGLMDEPEWWYDPSLKWTPVAQAMRAFFADPAAEGISASMGLFPALLEEDKCVATSYETPEVPMTALPSPAFDAVLDAYEAEVGDPLAGGNWRGGTPTLEAVQGTVASLEELRATEPDAEYVMVLVTDGLPIGCPDANLDAVADALGALYADGVPTYVIGIQNPTEPPEELPAGWEDWGTCKFGSGGGDTPCEPENNLDALGQLAQAGGTEEALLLDTDDPARTQEELTTAMLAIAEATVSCEVPIPSHPEDGETFEPDKIDVVARIDGDDVRLEYDDTCEIDLAWHYDDEDDPTTIQLCPESCDAVQADPNGALTVQFLCEPRPPVVK